MTDGSSVTVAYYGAHWAMIAPILYVGRCVSLGTASLRQRSLIKPPSGCSIMCKLLLKAERLRKGGGGGGCACVCVHTVCLLQNWGKGKIKKNEEEKKLFNWKKYFYNVTGRERRKAVILEEEQLHNIVTFFFNWQYFCQCCVTWVYFWWWNGLMDKGSFNVSDTFIDTSEINKRTFIC